MCRPLFAALLVALIPGWATPQDRKTPNYYPLAKGNKSEYQLEAKGQKIEATSEVTKAEVKDGKTVATTEVKFFGQTLSEEVSSDEKGAYRHSFQRIKLDTPLTILKYPVKAGTTWTEKVKGGGMELEAKFTVKEPEKVTVPAGTYDKAVPVDMALEGMGQKVNATSWYADGVGIVKQSVEVMGRTITLELKKFTAGK
jgi:hypothetical protein